MLKAMLQELKDHAPFTVFGAVSGIVAMILFRDVSARVSYAVFYTLHPMHVVLSALVTASMYQLHKGGHLRGKYNICTLLVIGYFGAIGIATVSDSLLPYLGEIILDMPHRHAHIGFIEQWWLINPLAILGVAIAYYWPMTKVPHAGHVLLSTWASLFHIIMAQGTGLSTLAYIAVFLFLFLAVWLPCCLSDIVFPLLFVKEQNKDQTPQSAP